MEEYRTTYLYAFDKHILSDHLVGITDDDNPYLKDDIYLTVDEFIVLSPNTVGPFKISPLPKWIIDRYWGEEFRGSKLDLPEAVQVAKDLLREAEPPADLVDYSGTPRPTKQEVKEAKEFLDDCRDPERYPEERQIIENAEKARVTGQIFNICRQVFKL